MTMFGSHEAIHTQSFDKALAKKTTYQHGDSKNTINKAAESFHVQQESDVLSHVISTIKSIQAGTSDYACIELFADEHKITRLNICTITKE